MNLLNFVRRLFLLLGWAQGAPAPAIAIALSDLDRERDRGDDFLCTATVRAEAFGGAVLSEVKLIAQGIPEGEIGLVWVGPGSYEALVWGTWLRPGRLLTAVAVDSAGNRSSHLLRIP